MGKKVDLGEKWKPEPATSEEIAFSSLVQGADFEIYSYKLELICAEAREVFVRMGVAQMLQSGDVVIGIYTANGDMASCVLGTHIHVITGQIPIKYVIERYSKDGSVGIRDGDMFFCNEATVGGIHNPDMLLFMPVFHDEKLVAWVLAAVHQGETGAVDPGGQSPRAKTRYDEGMHITPIKVGENFKLRQDILDLFANMVRDPREIVIDTKARAAACMRARKRILKEIIEKKGVDFFIGLLRENIERAALAARKRVERLPDGVFRSVIFLDGIGETPCLMKISLALRKSGSEITLDFSGTSPETRLGPWNSFTHIIAAATAVYLCQFFYYDLPPSAGLMVPFNYIVPDGCLLNASADAALGMSVITAGLVAFYAIHVCFSKMLFGTEHHELSCAGWWMPSPPFIYGGVNQWGQPIAGLFADQLNSAGSGARNDRDGENVAGFTYCPVGIFPDAEFNELQIPIMYLFRNRHMTDNHGFGKYRGGSGIAIAVVPHNADGLEMASSMGGTRIPPNSGLFGGYATLVPPGVQVTETDLPEMFENSDPNIPYSLNELVTQRSIKGDYKIESPIRSPRWIKKGDVLIQTSFGGGSYGDPLERDPELVVRDVEEKITSLWVAREIYKVAIDEETLVVNHEETDKLREIERVNRKKRGVPYKDFIQQWNKKRPDEEILQHYGTWPDPA
jgi:N-methylhydantoinase B/oxoprolinase/acetone carboxylase alpha subunit